MYVLIFILYRLCIDSGLSQFLQSQLFGSIVDETPLLYDFNNESSEHSCMVTSQEY